MITANNWEVIQGDEGCRDGHYRDKQDLHSDTVNGLNADLAATNLIHLAEIRPIYLAIAIDHRKSTIR